MAATDGTARRPWVLDDAERRFGVHRVPRRDRSTRRRSSCRSARPQLRYHLRCLDDLHAMLVERGDWVPLGNADEQKPAAEGTVEAWARAADNPVGGWYGLKKGLRGRFANYVPPVMEQLGLAEVEHNARNNRMRARDRDARAGAAIRSRRWAIRTGAPSSSCSAPAAGRSARSPTSSRSAGRRCRATCAC